MLAEILRFRPCPRGSGGPLALLFLSVAAGFAGGSLDDGPYGRYREERVGRVTRPPETVTTVREVVAPPPAPLAPPVEVLASAPPAPPPPAADPVVPVVPEVPPSPPATSPPSESAPPASIRAAQTQPVPIPWILSSGPLAASPPVRVDISAVGATASIDPLGLNPDGTLEVPHDFSRAGWYTGRPTPGETGPAIIVAHRRSSRGPGAFWHLPEVQPGQEIVVTRADGKRVVFVVDRLEQHQKSAFPTDAVYGPTLETGLRLITCGGPSDPTLGDHYRDNVIVFARMTAWAA